MSRLIAMWICVVLTAAVPSPAIAQTASRPPETRAEVLRRSREEKARTATPYRPNALERGMRLAEERVTRVLAAPDGLHPKLGSLTTGSGFSFGAGYRNRRLLEREGALTAWAAGSLKKYWAVEGRFDLPDLASGRLTIGAYARRHNYPQEDFFGVGPGALRGDHANFQFENTLFGARAGLKPTRIATFGGGVEYMRPEVGRGRNDALPTITDRFDDLSAPGLSGAHTFLRASAYLDVDYRQPKHARRGGLYRLEASRVADASGAFTFRRFDADLRQYASILAERRVLAVRLFVSTSDPAAGARVPFYLMPSLGGHDSLRGFRDYRFRGPHAILTQTEYRWEIWSGFDAALFYDAGKVALERSHLNLKRLEDAYGFGFRFNTDNGAIFRIDAGFGSRDGKHLYIVFGDVF
jgi:Omp85 superfamily domain